MSVTVIGDPTVCATHKCKLVRGMYMGCEMIELCPKCHHSGGCPTHPQSGVWRYIASTPQESGDRCPICGYWYDGRDPPPPEPAVVRSFAHYRELASRTDGNHDLQYYAGGLCEEAGELWRQVKRERYHGHPRDHEEVVKELGDALWLLDQLAKHYGVTLEEAATANVAKLLARYPAGFSPEASQRRR